MRKGEEFHTEITELRHRERGEVPASFSVHSVVKGSMLLVVIASVNSV